MQKPNNFDNTRPAGEFTPVELGGHYMIIKQVKEMQTQAGQPMIVVYFDFAQNDKQAGYFAEKFKNDIRPEKKWPNNGTEYIMVNDQDGNCSRNFKGFCSSVEKSNPGFQTQWGDGFADCFKNKMVGGVFGEVTDFYNEKEFTKHELRWFRSVDKIADAEIPKPTQTKQWKEWKEKTEGTPSPVGDGFMNIPDSIDEELPFN